MVTDMGQDTRRGLKIPQPSRAPTNEVSSKMWQGMSLLLLEGGAPASCFSQLCSLSGLAVYIICLDIGRGWSPWAALSILARALNKIYQICSVRLFNMQNFILPSPLPTALRGLQGLLALWACWKRPLGQRTSQGSSKIPSPWKSSCTPFPFLHHHYHQPGPSSLTYLVRGIGTLQDLW